MIFLGTSYHFWIDPLMKCLPMNHEKCGRSIFTKSHDVISPSFYLAFHSMTMIKVYGEAFEACVLGELISAKRDKERGTPTQNPAKKLGVLALNSHNLKVKYQIQLLPYF